MSALVDVREFGGVRIPSRLHNRLDRIAKAVRLRWATALWRGLKLSAPARLEATDLTESEVAAAFDAIAEVAGDRPFVASEEWHPAPAPEAPETPPAAPPKAPKGKGKKGKGKGKDAPKHSEGHGVKIQSWVTDAQADALRAWGKVTVGPDATMTEILRAACEYFRIGGGK